MSKEIPILFSTPMVEAILSGKKCVTRRIVKYPKIIEDPQVGFTMFTLPGEFSVRGKHANGQYGESIFKMKWQKGDLLWVRESWNTLNEFTSKPEYDVMGIEDFVYRAGDVRVDKWKPSIHMPKQACRIWLQVEGVRVERLNDITEEDAIKEGIQWYQESGMMPRYKDYMPDARGYGDPGHDYPTVGLAVTSFATLWEKINGAECFNENPWVFVVSFKVLSTTGMNKEVEFLRYGHDLSQDYKNIKITQVEDMPVDIWMPAEEPEVIKERQDKLDQMFYLGKDESSNPLNGAIATETE